MLSFKLCNIYVTILWNHVFGGIKSLWFEANMSKPSYLFSIKYFIGHFKFLEENVPHARKQFQKTNPQKLWFHNIYVWINVISNKIVVFKTLSPFPSICNRPFQSGPFLSYSPVTQTGDKERNKRLLAAVQPHCSCVTGRHQAPQSSPPVSVFGTWT